MIEDAKFVFRKGDTYSRDFTITDYEFDISSMKELKFKDNF